MKRAPIGPITIRGVKYEDDDAAAAALGVNRKTVRKAIREGRQEFIGIPAHISRKTSGSHPVPVRIRGEVYRNAEEAAKALDVSPITVRRAIQRGQEDMIGARKHARATLAEVSALREQLAKHYRVRDALADIIDKSLDAIMEVEGEGSDFANYNKGKTAMREWFISNLQKIGAVRVEGSDIVVTPKGEKP